MTRRVHTMGDQNNGQGVINVVHQSKVFSESKLVSTSGDFGTTHDAGGLDGGWAELGLPGLPPAADAAHDQNIWTTIGNAGSKVFIGGKPVVAEGDTDSCLHVRIGGSSKLFIG